jgi:two-component system invasion response regulator UvrY
MKPSQKKDVLILARSSIHLYCSALAELLTAAGPFEVHLLEEGSPPVCGPNNPCSLIVLFPGYPVLTSTSRVAKLRGKNTKVLMVLGSNIQLAIRYITTLNVDGIIPSDVDYAEFLTAINTLIFRNRKYLSPMLLSSLNDTSLENPFSRLSKKELDVALITTKGKRNVEIASELNISPKTVNTYKSRIFKKLGITNDMQLLQLILENNSLDESRRNLSGEHNLTRH